VSTEDEDAWGRDYDMAKEMGASCAERLFCAATVYNCGRKKCNEHDIMLGKMARLP
jgi:hypothetical protein